MACKSISNCFSNVWVVPVVVHKRLGHFAKLKASRAKRSPPPAIRVYPTDESTNTERTSFRSETHFILYQRHWLYLSSLLTVPSFHSILRLGLQTIMVLTFSLRVIATICKGLYQGRNIPTPIKPSQVMTTYHRCWFRDIDFFMHMNNAMYFRHFELARWELLPRTGLLQHALKENWMFLAVEQDCKYLKIVRPLTKFECRSSITIADNKWLDFHHSLWSMDGKTLYSEGMVRAVVKRRNGKTVRPSEFPEFIAPNNAIEH